MQRQGDVSASGVSHLGLGLVVGRDCIGSEQHGDRHMVLLASRRPTSVPAPVAGATSLQVAFIGLGVMGFPAGRPLGEQGPRRNGVQSAPARAEEWCAHYPGGRAPTPRDAAAQAEMVFCCVGNDDDLSVALGRDGHPGWARAGGIMSTTPRPRPASRASWRRLPRTGPSFHRCAGVRRSGGCRERALTIMCGGEPDPFIRAEPVLRAYGRAVTLLGPPGAAS